MTTVHAKRRISFRAARIIFCTALYAVLVLFIVGLFLFSNNYAKIYDSPAVRNGRADFSDTDLPSRDVACNLAGNWEFFYNQWIVTDQLDGIRDGMLKLPALWTYKDFGNGALPRTGYASYRMYAENVQPDIDIIVYRHYCNFAYRVFINGQLNVRSGELSKQKSQTVVTGRTDERHPYHTDGGLLEVVIEVSATDGGGFHSAPWLAATTTGNSYGSDLRSGNYLILGIVTAAVVVSILSCAFFRYERDFAVPAFMLALFAHFLSSKDMLYVFGLQITAAMALQFVSAMVSFVFLVPHFRRQGAVLKKGPVIVTSVAASLFTALLFAFYGTPLAAVFAFSLLAVGCYYLLPAVFHCKFSTAQCGVYGALFLLLMSVFSFELCDGLGLLAFGTEFIFTYVLTLIIICFAVLWLWKLTKSANIAVRVGELERELSTMKNKALKAQIKPHFVFNSLTAIQARYRDGLQEGDEAIERFANHLRLITDSDGEDMIAFDDEVRNVLNYFELENLRAGGKLNLLLDLNYADFSVPVLSLQPLVENAIKHGGFAQRQDGYIWLVSVKTDASVVITVSDNGAGFDVSALHEGVGLGNIRKRFALLNAVLKVESERELGTRITIEIPLE